MMHTVNNMQHVIWALIWAIFFIWYSICAAIVLMLPSQGQVSGIFPHFPLTNCQKFCQNIVKLRLLRSDCTRFTYVLGFTSYEPCLRYTPQVFPRIMRPGFKVITSLREPVERYLSFFFYNKGHSVNKHIDELKRYVCYKIHYNVWTLIIWHHDVVNLG